jgi:hypothetical protein
MKREFSIDPRFTNQREHVERPIYPSSLKLSDVTDDKQDLCDLCNNCQMHGCSGYCMYRINTKKRKVAELDEHQSIQGKASQEPQETIS